MAELAVAGEGIRIRKGDALVELRPVSEKDGARTSEQMSPREALRQLQAEARLTPKQAQDYLQELHAERLAAETAASMIHLDTNYLIGLLVKGSPQALEVDGWLAAGELLAASAIAWTEFLNGPVTAAEVGRAEAVLQSRIIPFGQAEPSWLPNCSTKPAGAAARALIALSPRQPQWRARKSRP